MRCLSVPVLLLAAGLASQSPTDYRKDVEFALDALEQQCGTLLKQKRIDWSKVRREFASAAKHVESDAAHLVLLTRLLARLQDGHAAVVGVGAGKDVKWPDPIERTGPGFFLCVIGKTVAIKNSWGDAKAAGIDAGTLVTSIDGVPARKWLDQRVAELRDLHGFSSEQQALFYACHQGLADPPGTRRKLELRDPATKKTSKRTLTYAKASAVPFGPAFFPGKLAGDDSDLGWTRTEAGFGYIHVRRCPDDLPQRFDRALAELADAPGLILDFRGNSGGGFDHDALLGRFVPAGQRIEFEKTIASAGPNPFGGPVVVIVDATVRSAGETASGMFRYDGRAYVIGESATAGMSASKQTIELPSGLFSLYVAVSSNKQRYNEGRGLEGIGTVPHEIVAFDTADLAAERDTLILRAEALLTKFPQSDVPYDPADYGWRKPAK